MKHVNLTGRPPLVAGLVATALIAAAFLLLFLGNAGDAGAVVPPEAVSLQMHTVPSVEPGINLSMREKRLASQTHFTSDRVVILLEPFGVPAAEAFDSALPGFNMMDYLARNGYDVFALDFRGFGASGRPPAFNQPMMANPPQMRTPDAEQDVEAAVQYICSLRSVSKTNILGWSWGAVVAAKYAGDHPEKMERLVIYGGMHAFLLPFMTSQFDDPNNPGHIMKLPAYQLTSATASAVCGASPPMDCMFQ